MSTPRVGLGFDLHRLKKGKKMILGGVEIPGDRGPVGHSDGDVVLHALSDAIRSGVGLPDIGETFPPGIPRTQGIDSAEILADAITRAAKKKKRVVQVTAIVFLESPKLGRHKERVKARLAKLLGLDRDQVAVHAKTFEGIRAIGAGTAVACQSLVVLEGRR